MATRPVPPERVLSPFDPILNVATPVVHIDHFPGGELGIGNDEPNPREEFPVVPLDLSDTLSKRKPLSEVILAP